MRKVKKNIPLFRRNQGIAMIMGIVSLLAIVALTTLAMHAGNLMLYKARLQNAVDAAALSAAVAWVSLEDPLHAEASAKETFIRHLSADGGQALAGQANLLTGEAFWELVFLSSINPVTVENNPADPTDTVRFVRVRILNAAIDGLMARIYDFDSIDMSASAIAGPSPGLTVQACDVTPMLVCGDPDNHGDTDGDGEQDVFYGFEEGQVHMLKLGPHTEDQPLGSGNFHLLNLPDSQGGADIRENLAGSISGCLTSEETVETQTGVLSGPVAQGLNTRFGYPGNQLDTDAFPADIVSVNPNVNRDDGGYDQYTADNFSSDLANPYRYGQYQNDVVSCLGDQSQDICNDPGTVGRRVITMVVGDCSGETAGEGGGNTDLTVFGFGCFFLPQSVNLGSGGDVEVYGEFTGGCNEVGGFSPTTPEVEDSVAPNKIILYKDPDWNDA